MSFTYPNLPYIVFQFAYQNLYLTTENSIIVVTLWLIAVPVNHPVSGHIKL